MSSLSGLHLRDKAKAGVGGLTSKGGNGGGGLRDKATGLLGKGKSGSSSAENHQSTPLSALKDPASFGPPPRRTTGPYSPGSPTTITRTDTGGLGGALPKSQIELDRQHERERKEAAQQIEAPPKPSGPYRADTTGLSTSHLPKPPVFRPSERTESPVAAYAERPKPSLPPRLPPRNPSSNTPPSPPPPYNDTSLGADPSRGMLNQGAMARLGQAGVSVPGFEIGGRTPPLPPPSRITTASPPVTVRTNSASPPLPSRPGAIALPPAISSAREGHQLGEIQSRFAKMNTASSPPAAGTGTTWVQKRAALKTASDFKKDPSSVSFSDARAAASTANNFRERHGEQAAAGYTAANNVNQKYGVLDKVNSQSLAASKKPPPPPPPAKRSDLQSGPPPVPLSTKPRP